MACGQVSQCTGSLPERRKKVCGNLDIEKEPLKVKHSLEFLPMASGTDPTRYGVPRAGVTWQKENEYGDAHVHLGSFFWDLRIIFGQFL